MVLLISQVRRALSVVILVVILLVLADSLIVPDLNLLEVLDLLSRVISLRGHRLQLPHLFDLLLQVPLSERSMIGHLRLLFLIFLIMALLVLRGGPGLLLEILLLQLL